MDDRALMDLLLRDDPAFKALHAEHQACEQALDELRAKRYLTDAEAVEEKELKKRKLTLKDEMYRLMSAYRAGEGRA